MRWTHGALVGGLLATLGCGPAADFGMTDPPVLSAPAEWNVVTSESDLMLHAPRDREFPGITLTIPAGWEERPRSSDMIHAEYQLDGPAGVARLTLSSTGGGLEANLERWRNQFQRQPDDPAPQQTAITVDGKPAMLIELWGTFHDGFRRDGHQPDWSMLGAAIPTGPAHFFVKLTGPRETVAVHREAIRNLVLTARLQR